MSADPPPGYSGTEWSDNKGNWVRVEGGLYTNLQTGKQVSTGNTGLGVEGTTDTQDNWTPHTTDAELPAVSIKTGLVAYPQTVYSDTSIYGSTMGGTMGMEGSWSVTNISRTGVEVWDDVIYLNKNKTYVW